MGHFRCTNEDCQKLDGWLVEFSDDHEQIDLTCSYCSRSITIPLKASAIDWPSEEEPPIN